jgi:hypothetical protein
VVDLACVSLVNDLFPNEIVFGQLVNSTLEEEEKFSLSVILPICIILKFNQNQIN